MKRFRGGLIFKAHRLVYHPTLGSRVMKKRKKSANSEALVQEPLREIAHADSQVMPRSPPPLAFFGGGAQYLALLSNEYGTCKTVKARFWP